MTAPLTKKLRCAVYTRKSSEEGLEQAFNSLDAQREAAVAYIKSQKHEGWELVPDFYDDGGYSGGNVERPALQQLLKDIEAKKVDVIVVYKVDRLSRSLGDFAQMMTMFEKLNVSFVSVTQQFNTTTSMGRLTLNILLSFAQFEREVTGERIRDKFTASKKKGIFMGGNPPLGYQIVDRKLIIIDPEAELVRKIFQGYLLTHSLLELAESLNAEGYTTKHWTSRSDRLRGGNTLKPTYLNYILRNHIYRGKINHKGKIYEGQHDAIIDEETWQAVQDSIKRQDRNGRHRWKSYFLLKGKLKTYEGFSMSPSYKQVNDKTNKHKNYTGGKANNFLRKQVRYYVSSKGAILGHKTCLIKRMNATLLEVHVTSQIIHFLRQQHNDVAELLNNISEEMVLNHWLRSLIDNVVVGPEKLIITLNTLVLDEIRQEPSLLEWQQLSKSDNELSLLASMEKRVWYQPTIREEKDKVVITLDIMIKRVNGIRAILSPDGKDIVLPSRPEADASIVQAIGRGFKWRQLMDEQPELSLAKFSATCGFGETYVTRQLMLLRLAPDIIHRALTGTLPSAIKLNRLAEAAESLSWEKQRKLLELN